MELPALSPEDYARLRAIAEQVLRSRRRPGSLQTTSLVHEAYLTLARPSTKIAGTEGEFHTMVARAMRSVLIDQARRRNALKRAGEDAGPARNPADENGSAAELGGENDWIALDDALTRLALIDERKARVVELRFFSGLEIEAIASALGVSSATVKRDWLLAKAWLFRELQRSEPRP